MINPLTKGNLILFKGETNTGKTRLTHSIARNFVKEDPEHKVVYVTLSHSEGSQLLDSMESDLRQNVICIGVGGAETPASDAEFILAPQVGLKLASQQKKVLFVFDDVILHHFKEKHVYNLAG